MMENFILNQKMLDTMVVGLANKLKSEFSALIEIQRHILVAEGSPDAKRLIYALGQHVSIVLISDKINADIIIDLVFNTGSNCRNHNKVFKGTKPFYVLIDKSQEPCDFKDKYVVFPWQVLPAVSEKVGMHKTYDDLTPESRLSIKKEAVYDLIQDVMELNPNREGLKDTPARVVKAWQHWTSGYNVDIAALLKVFEDGAEKYDEMVIVKDIPIYSHCEHHLAAIFGTCTIAYIPNGKIVGLSKLSRLADAFARRLQVQERLTSQIADALNDNLSPKGVGVIIKARHLCMESRGVCQQGHHTITSALRGVIKDDPTARAEFLQLAN